MLRAMATDTDFSFKAMSITGDCVDCVMGNLFRGPNAMTDKTDLALSMLKN